MDRERSSLEGCGLFIPRSIQTLVDARGNTVYRQVLMGIGSLDGKEIHFFFFVFFPFELFSWYWGIND